MLHDFAKDGFLYQISDPDVAITLTTASTNLLFSGSVDNDKFADFLHKNFGYHLHSNPINYSKVKRILLPRNVADSHWILYCLFTDTRQVACMQILNNNPQLKYADIIKNLLLIC